MPKEMLEARVVSIFKKGDASNMENYRPISLLNSLYKIYAAILQNRLQAGVDKFLQKTQYGFRKERGTRQAIHCIRRILDRGEASQEKILLVLLDWEKAFDKVTREAISTSLERMNVDNKMINAIMSLYKEPRFKVEIDGKESNWYDQQTGIRQGCPLSPYLFLIVMTAMFHDVHQEVYDKTDLVQHRVQGTSYDEVLYADDTICISSDTRSMNILIAEIEKQGAKYGLKLNKGKCEAIVTGDKAANLHFGNGEKIKIKDKVKYLGAILNKTRDMDKEVKQRIAICMSTLKRLDLFWRHSDCPTKFKLLVQDAVIRSKLLYGLESAEIKDSTVKRLDTFQLKGLRKVLRMDTTYINRSNTNQKVINRANEEIANNEGEPQKNKQPISLYSQVYTKQKILWIQEVIAAPSQDPIKETAFNPSTFKKWSIPLHRRGAPKKHWFESGKIVYWKAIRETLTSPYKHQEWETTPRRRQQMQHAAENRAINKSILPTRLFA